MNSAELVVVWIVPGDPERREYAEQGPALARAWELTPPGGQRSEPQQELSAREKAMQAIPMKPRTVADLPKMSSGVVPPKNPEVGDLWYDSAGKSRVRVWRGDSWHEVES